MLKQSNILMRSGGGTTPLGPIRGGQFAKRSRVLSAFRDSDDILGNGRRVLGRVGLHGEERHQIVSTSTSSLSQTYPLKTASRVAFRWKGLLTPGHWPTVSALFVPSGATQTFSAMGGSWVLDVAVGWIDVTVAFTGPASETVTHIFSLPASGEVNAGEGAAAGWAWSALRRFGPAMVAPAGALQTMATARTWSEGVTAEITIAYRGGVRCVDLVVQETPGKYARSLGVDAASTFTAPLAVGGTGFAPATYPSTLPLEETSATDPTFGAKLLADVIDRQHSRLGPVLAQWSGWREAGAVTLLEGQGVTTTSLTYVNMLDTSLTVWAAAAPGWSLASGGQAQQYATSEPRRITRDADACVPVRCWLYGSRTGGAAAVRFQTADYSIAEVNVTSSTAGWWSATGHLRCGLGPEDTSVLQLLGKLAAAGTLTIRYVVVEYLDT